MEKKFQILPLVKHLRVRVGGDTPGSCTITVQRTTFHTGRLKVYAEWRCYSRRDAERVLDLLTVWAPRFSAGKAGMEELHRKVAPELRA